ncbi:flagellar biosynthetic protein FliR [Phorcysia thermohydrogeniphila]|uniref:Flagellar biosynthetic protein FliR n=1 Tax=Phorcysia thermohydrogeniphila TaxID=936138 RepID=A0A4R1GI46_9BACT|nr:flagellar biosynthetic protein FliR [Phorcysia thermohydrogeniphila]TCK03872.1 flagellar biosynthetic protein FliR [Phorcysia thermohydrogeniphila]
MSQLIDLNVLSLFLLVLLRVGAFMLAFPFFSTAFVPPNVRVFLIVAFSFYLSELIGVSPFNIIELDTVSLFILVLKEVLVGVALSISVLVFYAIVIYAAELLSYLMGLTVVNMFDPTFGMVSVIGRFFVFLFYLLFFTTGAYRLFIAAMVESFHLIPPGHFHVSDSLLSFFLSESSLIFILGFKLAFPFLITLFITNLILALINRLIPQINVFIVGLPFQVFVGLLFLAIGFSVVVYVSEDLVKRMVTDIIGLIRILSGNGG